MGGRGVGMEWWEGHGGKVGGGKTLNKEAR